MNTLNMYLHLVNKNKIAPCNIVLVLISALLVNEYINNDAKLVNKLKQLNTLTPLIIKINKE